MAEASVLFYYYHDVYLSTVYVCVLGFLCYGTCVTIKEQLWVLVLSFHYVGPTGTWLPVPLSTRPS